MSSARGAQFGASRRISLLTPKVLSRFLPSSFFIEAERVKREEETEERRESFDLQKFHHRNCSLPAVLLPPPSILFAIDGIVNKRCFHTTVRRNLVMEEREGKFCSLPASCNKRGEKKKVLSRESKSRRQEEDENERSNVFFPHSIALCSIPASEVTVGSTHTHAILTHKKRRRLSEGGSDADPCFNLQICFQIYSVSSQTGRREERDEEQKGRRRKLDDFVRPKNIRECEMKEE